MSFKLGLTGMDPATRATLEELFQRANAQVGGAWTLVPEPEAATHVIVDMDSMYGPMSWLRLHGDGKSVIGLTTAPRSQADHHLQAPADADGLARVLAEIAPGTVSPSGLTPAPQATDQLPEEQPGPLDEETSAPERFDTVGTTTGEFDDPREPGSAAVASVVPAAPTVEPPAPPAAMAPDRARTLGEWLAAGEPGHRFALEREGTTVLVDPAANHYFGPAGLRPVSAHVTAVLERSELGPEPSGWDGLAASMGAAQPLSRLLWYGALLAGGGRLAAGFDPAARYQLLKWPQTEREFPRHFRIATVMMRGPATLQDIADASGVPLEEVTDFVNANLATGFARPEQPAAPTPPPKGGGLFGRLRGR